jgi:16S rRNA C967 or C1407 C5-methylase (RsmB/RsmF family)
MKNTTEQFKLAMASLLPAAETADFFNSLTRPLKKSVRFHSQRTIPSLLPGSPVPWNQPFGRFWQETINPSQTIEYAAGRYYIQEASAMLAIALAESVIDLSDKTVLDLAAAPGGKTTQLAEHIQRGFLVSNEIDPKRLPALIWNINRHRLHNTIVTSMNSRELSLALPEYFDVVLLDAPCSGEGLIQQKKLNIALWTAANVSRCALRQKKLLADACKLLKPGGLLIYSTCTFSRQENEDQIEHLLQNKMEAACVTKEFPVSAACADNHLLQQCCFRIWPHRQPGAGAFAALLTKQLNKKESALPIEPPLKSITGKDISDQDFFDFSSAKPFFFNHQGIISAFNQAEIPEFLFKNSCQIGAPLLNRLKGNRLLPGAIQFPRSDKIIPLNPAETINYLQGKSLPIMLPNGWYAVQNNQQLLGLIEIQNHQAHNHFPKSLQIQNR